MSVTSITPTDYHTRAESRDLADRLLALAGLDKGDVAVIERTATGWRFKIYESDANGKRYFDLDGEIAHHWVDLAVSS